MIRTEGEEGNRRGLDTSWLRKGIRDQARQTQRASRIIYSKWEVFSAKPGMSPLKFFQEKQIQITWAKAGIMEKSELKHIFNKMQFLCSQGYTVTWVLMCKTICSLMHNNLICPPNLPIVFHR